MLRAKPALCPVAVACGKLNECLKAGKSSSSGEQE